MVGNSLAVLVVDDHPVMRSVLKKMLHQTGYFEVVEEAEDGEHAWEKLNAHSFDLVIADIRMPRLDGIELLKRCGAAGNTRDIPFLMISGESEHGVVAIAGEWGAYDYLVKPFSYSALKEKIDSVLERFRRPEALLFREVVRLRGAGRPQDALSGVEKLERIAPGLSAKWLNLKGEIYLDMGALEHAVDCFQQAISLAENFIPAYKNYSQAQLQLGNPDQALDALEKANLLSPLDADRKITLGSLLFAAGREDEGRRCFEEALKHLPPESREANRMKIAEVYLSSGHFEEAEKLYVRALKANPRELEVYNRLGIALRRQKKYDEAERYYNMALKNHPNNPVVYYNLAALHWTRQDRNKATEFAKKCLDLDPGFGEARALLDRIGVRGEPAPPRA